MYGKKHLIGHFCDDAWGTSQDIYVVDEFFEDFVIGAAVVGDQIGDEEEKGSEKIVSFSIVPHRVDHSLQVVDYLQPQLLLHVVV